MGRYIDDLRRSAAQLEVQPRLHFVKYVDHDQVPQFLSDASVGVYALTRYGNAEVAMPNKLFEYMHARLPVVCSDFGAMGAFVPRTGIGKVFASGIRAPSLKPLRPCWLVGMRMSRPLPPAFSSSTPGKAKSVS
jgi:glycosyltransferase involved in cell wall biosynthesis